MAEDRLHHLDLIRGAALVGVLLSNLQLGLAKPYDWGFLWEQNLHAFAGTANRVTEWLLVTLFREKSVTLFTMLFAIGLCIQRERILAKGLNWPSHAGRRLAALAVFGVCHVLLLWWGDVLHAYAVTGAILLLLLGRGDRAVRAWYVAGFLLLTALSLLDLGGLPPAQPPMMPVAEVVAIQRDIAAKTAGYLQAHWVDVMHFRLQDWLNVLPYDVAYLPFYLCIALLGVALWRTGVLRKPALHRAVIVRVTRVALGLGLLLAVLAHPRMIAFEAVQAHWGVWGWVHVLTRLTASVSGALLAVGYGGLLVLASLHPGWALALQPLNRYGRMAFTNYLMQSALCVAIFEGWGLGLYGQLDPLQTLLLGGCIVGLQIAISTWWLRRFRFGPLEWLWRCVTYWQRVPLARPHTT